MDDAWVRPDTKAADINVARVIIDGKKATLDNGSKIGPHTITFIDPKWDPGINAYSREISFSWSPLDKIDAKVAISVSVHMPAGYGYNLTGAVGDGWNAFKTMIKQVEPINYAIDSWQQGGEIGRISLTASDFIYTFTAKLKAGANFRIDLPIISAKSTMEILITSIVIHAFNIKEHGMIECDLSECQWLWKATDEEWVEL